MANNKWHDIIIQSPYARLTKQDVYDYYRNPKIKARLWRLRDVPVITRQSFDTDTVVLRRKDESGKEQRLTPELYNRLVKKRLTEIHPVVGKKTDTVVVDIDPGAAVPWQRTKEVTQRVAEHLRKTLPVERVGVQFSGNRGFYVKGKLPEKEDVNVLRSKLKNALQPLLNKELVNRPPEPHQIRLDVSPMKYRGSYKAPFSLDARTGLVAAPVAKKKLPFVEKEDFTIDKFSEDAMFAPGIPKERLIHPIPTIRNKMWQLAIQEHHAQRAGKHWDVRFVDPETQMAHSFAVPKRTLPTEKNIVLAIQQPTHTADYATTFSGTIPKGYGAGTVKLREVSPVRIEFATPNRIIFNRDGIRYVAFRMTGNNWGIRRL